MRIAALLLGACFAVSLAGEGLAAPPAKPVLTRKGQKGKTEEPKKARPAPLAPDSAHGPLSELSETLGALTLLTQLCAPDLAPNPWRSRMELLVDAEGEASGAAPRMNGAFNRGYADFATSYSRCTPAAKAAEEALRREAARLSRLLTQRYGS